MIRTPVPANKKKLAQFEKDDAAFGALPYRHYLNGELIHMRETWHAALEWERKRIKKK